MRKIRITGVKGSFEVCAHTGMMITPFTQIPRDYRYFCKANLKEVRSWALRHGLTIGDELKLLCVGMHSYDGRYAEPLEVFRDQLMLEEPELIKQFVA